jgi:hypothetical protein
VVAGVLLAGRCVSGRAGCGGVVTVVEFGARF